MKPVTEISQPRTDVDELHVVISSDPKYQGDIDALQDHPLFRSLTDNQRKFLLAYIDTRDRTKAALSSGDFSSDHSAAMAAARYMRDYRISYLLGEFDGHPVTEQPARMTTKELEFLIAQRLRSSALTDSAFASLVDRLIEIRSWRKKPQPAVIQAAATTTKKARPEPETEPAEPEPTDPFEAVRLMEAKRKQ